MDFDNDGEAVQELSLAKFQSFAGTDEYFDVRFQIMTVVTSICYRLWFKNDLKKQMTIVTSSH